MTAPAAAWVDEQYPGKRALSRAEAMEVLREGPRPEWFRPFAEHLPLSPQTSHPWGYIHVHGEWGADPVWEVVGFHSAQDLRWGLHSLLTRDHDYFALDVDGHFNEHECHGVFYWLPGDPHDLPLRLGVTK